MAEVKVIKFDVDWTEIKNACRKTISMGDSIVEPSSDWKRKLLLAEHSPLRHSLITLDIQDVPFYVMGHLVRHSVGVTPYVGTSREDRTGVDRSERRQTDLVSMRLDLNIQSLINISRKRLCNQADKQTQMLWLQVVRAIAEIDEDIAWACVPEGIRTCGCPEAFGDCRACTNIVRQLPPEDMVDVTKRYNHYAKHRAKVLKRGETDANVSGHN